LVWGERWLSGEKLLEKTYVIVRGEREELKRSDTGDKKKLRI
jgi:hypothetical protein